MHSTDLIFENYDRYLSDHRAELDTPAGAIEMLSSDGSFRSYVSALTEGMSPDQKASVVAVCEREREFLLQESATLGPSANIIGYAVTYFPILADIYSNPVLVNASTVYPTSKPILTIPKVEVRATVLNSDGTTSSYLMPRSRNLVRGTMEDIPITAGVNNNLFTMSDGAGTLVTSTLARINKRYFMFTDVEITGTGDGGDTTNIVTVNVRPDARGQLHKEFTFTDDNADTVTVTLIGNINWDTGIVNFNCSFPTGTDATYSAHTATCKVMFSPKSGEVGRVKVSIRTKGWDVDVDTRDDFEIELETETIQDYKDIYNIDLVRTMSEAIKTQIMLNKDHDIAYFLSAAETEMAQWGASSSIDMSAYFDGADVISPPNLGDVFKSIIPRLAIVNRVVSTNFGATPQFILTGLQTSALLESLQRVAVNMSSVNQGDFGFASDASAFAKQTILYSPVISDTKIYTLYKAPSDNMSRAVLLDIVYKPLYIIEEITNSLKRTFVKSRTAVEFVESRACGVVSITGTSSLFGGVTFGTGPA